jgi:photosystem II stability/assembly factor-like uncharacterized protein
MKHSLHHFLILSMGLLLSISLQKVQATRLSSPQSYSVTQLPTYINYGGRAVSVAINPLATNEAVVASESGGLFKTTNSGSTWSHIGTLPMFRLRDVKYHPVTVQGYPVLLVSTWANGHWPMNEGGFWRSLDNGQTWEHPSFYPYNTQTGCTFNVSTHGIALDPTSGLVVAGNDCGLQISQDYGYSFTQIYTNTVVSVAISPGPVIDICTPTGHKRAGPDLHFGPYTIQGGGCASVHGLATSPTESYVVYLAKNVPNLAGCDARTHRSTILMEGVANPTWTTWTWREASPTMCFQGGREPWVATYPSRDQNGNHYDVYFGDAARLWRNTCNTGGTGARCNPNNWVQTPTDHADQNHLAFDPAANCAKYMVSDGGIHSPTDFSNNTTCGSNWAISGKPQNGYNALQIYDVAATTYPDHVRLYIGTQDNALWYSPDGGSTWPRHLGNEGFFLQAPLTATTPIGQQITFADPGEGRNRIAPADFTTSQLWNDPPGNRVDVPTRVDGSVFLQYTYPTANVYGTNVTTNYGSIWSDRFTSIAMERLGRQQISLQDNQVFMYQGFKYPGDIRPRDLRQGLIQISGVSRSGIIGVPRVVMADVNGLGSIGIYPMGEGCFVLPSVFGVDPRNPNHLIAADIEDSSMKESLDGGIYWTENVTLTKKVIDANPFGSPHYDFYLRATVNPPYATIPGARLQPHVIAFDPFMRNHILVGTENVGVIESFDGGRFWVTLPGTSQIPSITSFAFQKPLEGSNEHTFYVSSYGRGLWKIVSPAFFRVYLFPQALGALWQQGTILDTFTADSIDFFNFDDPQFCYRCQIFTSTHAYISDILIDGGAVAQINLSQGHMIGSDTQGNPMKLDIPTVLDEAVGEFNGCNACQEVIAAGGTIRGVVLKPLTSLGNMSSQASELFAIIVSYGELSNAEVIDTFDAFPPEVGSGPETPYFTAPYITLGSNYNYGAQSAVATGETLEISGFNWGTAPDCGSVLLVLDDSYMLYNGPPLDEWGTFDIHPQVFAESGYHYLTATQTCGDTEYYDAQWLLVIIKEEWWEEENMVFLPILLR